jgi:LysM repeat protein
MEVRAKLVKAITFVIVAGLISTVLWTPALAASTRTHIVRPGESLSSIASSYGVSVSAIQAENGITDPNFIYVGQRLRIPGGSGSGYSGATKSPGYQAPSATQRPSHLHDRAGASYYYIVRQGDTLYKISRMFGVSVADIVQANNLRSYFIWVGERLRIPKGHVAPGTSPVIPTRVVLSRPMAPSVRPTSAAPGGNYSGPTFYYVVRPGDTLSGLAARFRTSVSDIRSANGLVSDWLYVGQRLRIPGTGNHYVAPRPKPTPGYGVSPKPTPWYRVSPTPFRKYRVPSAPAPTLVAPTPTTVPPTATPAPIPTATPEPVLPMPTPTFDKPTSP